MALVSVEEAEVFAVGCVAIGEPSVLVLAVLIFLVDSGLHPQPGFVGGVDSARSSFVAVVADHFKFNDSFIKYYYYQPSHDWVHFKINKV